MIASDKKTHRGCAGLSSLELGIVSLVLWLGGVTCREGSAQVGISVTTRSTQAARWDSQTRRGWTYLCIFIDVDRVVHADGLGTEDFTVSLEAVQLEQAGSRQQLRGQERGYLRS